MTTIERAFLLYNNLQKYTFPTKTTPQKYTFPIKQRVNICTLSGLCILSFYRFPIIGYQYFAEKVLTL